MVDAASGTERLTLEELARVAYFRPDTLPAGVQAELVATRHYVPRAYPFAFTNGVQASYLEVDTETGFVKLLKHWVVEDCGTIINPQLVDEQMRGGVVQGIGAALFEHCLYDERGQMLNGNMADYLVPMAAEMPDIECGHVVSPTADSELGAKGAGEAGTAGAPACVMNAINDALRPFGAAAAHRHAVHAGEDLARAGQGVSGYSAVQPPSSLSAAPVISEEASDARNTMAPVISSSCPSRPSLIFDSTSSRNSLFSKNGRVIGVSRKVGPSELTRILCGREFDRHGLGEALHGVLGGAIDGAPRRADMAHLRGDVDDRAGELGLDQPQRHRLRHEEGGAHIEIEDGVEVLDRHVRQIGRPVDAGIVDQDLIRRARRQRRTHRVDIGDVERERVGLLPARADGGGGFLDFLFGARDQRDMRAGIGQRRRGGQPDAAPAAGHQRAAAVEAEGSGLR